MRVFLTGWDGLLGSALTPLLKADHTVAGFGIADGDIADESFVTDRVGSFAPDTVIHLAAMTAVDRCEEDAEEAFRVNRTGTAVAARAAESVGAAFVTLSTDYAFDGRSREPYPEDAPPRPLSVYGRSKVAGEEAAAEESSRWSVVRSAWLFGPGGRNFVDTILGLLDTRDTVSVVDDQTGCPTYAPHLAGGLKTLVERGGRGVYHMVSGDRGTWFDLARAAAELSGLDPARVLPATTADLGRPAPRPVYSVLGTRRVREELGLDLPPWRDGLREYLRIRRSEKEMHS